MTHRLLIDTDPGVDDALAILMASAHPGCRIEALTITAGNVGLGHTLANALKLCEVADIDAPVFPGAPVPLVAVPRMPPMCTGATASATPGCRRLRAAPSPNTPRSPCCASRVSIREN